MRGPLLGKSSRLRLIPVVRKEAKGTLRVRGETSERETYKMKTRSEMIKLRIFLAYAGIKGGLREMECPPAERLDRVSFIYGQYHQNMVSFKNHLGYGEVPLVVVVISAPRLYTIPLRPLSLFYPFPVARGQLSAGLFARPLNFTNFIFRKGGAADRGCATRL